jgi:sugar lactone lactonase YvrE
VCREPVVQGQTGVAVQIHVAEWPRHARVFFRSAVVAVSAVYFGLFVQSFTFAQAEPLPDLVVNAVDAQGATTDVHTLALSGTLSAEIANTGTANSGGTVDVLAFHDVDHNNRFDSGVDAMLGQTTVAAPDAGASTALAITVTGQLPFRDAPIDVWVDSSQGIVESDEGNNVGTSASACVVDLPPDPDGTGITVASGFTVQSFASEVTNQQGPISLTFDSKGNLYMAPGDEGRIVKFPAGSNVPQLFGEVGISDPDGVAVDSQDNIIVSGDPVTKFTPNGEVIWQVSCPVDNIQLVTVDRDDNVYVGSLGTQICKIAPDGSSFVTLGSFNQPSELAVSPEGFLYISQLGARNIVKATLDTAEILEVINSPISAAQPAFDPVGDLFVGQRTGVFKIELPEKTISPFASGFGMARSLAFDMDGDLFVGDSARKNIYEFPATRQLDLTASLLRAVADSAGGVGLRVRIGNAGRSQSRGNLLVSFYEGDPLAGGLLLGSVTTGPIDAGDFRDVSLDGVSGLAGTVDLFAVVDADNRVPECNETNNTVQIPGDVIARLGQIGVSTDQVIYDALTPVFLQAQVTNNGTLAGVVSVALQVEDASGTLIQAFGAQDVGPLGPGESAAVNAEWNTATFAAGMYGARAVLRASDGSILSEATSGFEIRHSDTPGEVVVAALRTTTDRAVYHTTDVVQVRDLVGNLSVDTILSGTFLRLSILDPNGQTIFGQDVLLADLAPGGIAEITTPVQLRVATEGTFRVLGSVIDSEMNVLATDETQFLVQLDLRQALSGSVTAESATLDVGVPQVCIFRIRNNELVTIADLETHHSMLNLDTQQFVGDFSVQMNLGADTEDTTSRTFATDNLAAGEYACVLRARIGDTLETLASAPFTLTVPPIRIAAGIQVGARGRLLVLVDALDKNGNDGDPHGPKGVPGLTAQRVLLESLISGAGWSHTIVDSADDFARELRSGGYTVYALFAEDEMLSDRVQEELREAVFRGEGLVVAGLHDTRQQELDAPLGVRIAGNAKQASIVAVQSDELGVNGDVALIAKDNALRAEPVAATGAGTYEGGDVAVTTTAFGAGRSVFAGFDLLATAARDGDASFAAELLLAAFSYVHPSVITQTAGDVVPVEIALQNEGIATSVTVSLPVLSGTIIDPGTGSFDEVTRTLNWSFALAQGEVRTLGFWLQLPSGPAEVTLQARIEANSLLLAEPSARLDVLAPQDLASIFASIDALLAGDIDGKLRQAFEKARRKLQDAEARLPDDPENALKEALKVAEALAMVDDDKATLVRVTVGLWIKWIAQQL